MRTESFRLTATEEFQSEINRVCQQYPNFRRFAFTGVLHESLVRDFNSGKDHLKSMPTLIVNAWYGSYCVTVSTHTSAALIEELEKKLSVVFAPQFNYTSQLERYSHHTNDML